MGVGGSIGVQKNEWGVQSGCQIFPKNPKNFQKFPKISENFRKFSKNFEKNRKIGPKRGGQGGGSFLGEPLLFSGISRQYFDAFPYYSPQVLLVLSPPPTSTRSEHRPASQFRSKVRDVSLLSFSVVRWLKTKGAFSLDAWNFQCRLTKTNYAMVSRTKKRRLYRGRRGFIGTENVKKKALHPPFFRFFRNFSKIFENFGKFWEILGIFGIRGGPKKGGVGSSGGQKKGGGDRKSTRLNSSHVKRSRMPSSA